MTDPANDLKLTCYYCDEPAGVSEETGEDLGLLAEYHNGNEYDWLHPDCFREMMSNDVCGGGE